MVLKWVLVYCLLYLWGANSAIAETRSEVLDRNFTSCKQGYGDCNRSLLTAEQNEITKQEALERNFTKCKQGWNDCNRSLLTAEQSEITKQEALDRNFTKCKQGWDDCNRSLLTADQGRVVQREALERNFSSCKYAFPDCNPSLLTIEQSQLVKQEALDRNFSSCKYAFPDCNPSLLTAEQSEIAKQEALDRNLTSCKQGWNDCNRSLLAKSQTEPEAEIKEVSEAAKRNSKSTVFNVQFKLRQLGYTVGQKGQWDDASQTAAKQFVQDYGLEVDASYERILPYLQQAEAGNLKRTITKPELAVEPQVEVVESKPEPVVKPEPEPVIEAKVEVVKPESIATANPTPNIFDQFDEERKPTEVIEPKVEEGEPKTVVEPEPDRLVLETQRHLQALGYRVDYNGVLDTNSVEAMNQFIQDYGISMSSFLSAEDFLVYLRMALEGTLTRVDARPEPVVEAESEPVAVVKPEGVESEPVGVKPRAVSSSSKDFNISEYSFGELFLPPALKTLLIVLVIVTIWSVLRNFFRSKPKEETPRQPLKPRPLPSPVPLPSSPPPPLSPAAPITLASPSIPEPCYQAVVAKMVAAIEGSEKLLEFAHHFKYLPLKPVVGTWFSTVERWAKQCQGDVNLMTEAFLKHYESRLKQRFLEKSCDLEPITTPEYLLLDVKFQSFWEQEAYYRRGSDYPPDWRTRRTLVLMREHANCQRCGVLCDLNKAHIHHIIPKSQGGDHGLDNLALLCRDCHSCMPSEGHLDIRGYTRYLISNTRKLHTPECKYGGKSIWGKASSWQWQNDYTYCRLCDPLAYHHKQVQAWKPDIVRVFSLYREKIKQEFEASF